MLTGPPRVNGVLLPYPQYAGGGDGRIVWEPDHVYFDARGGRVIRQRRYYGIYNFGYNALPTKDYWKVVAALDLEDPVRLTLARAKDDPDDISETELRCAVESVVPVSGSGDKSPGVYSLDVKLRTLKWRATRGGVSENVLVHGFDFSESTDLFGGVQGSGTWSLDVTPYGGRLLRLEGREAGYVEARLYNDTGQELSTTTATLDAGQATYVKVNNDASKIEVDAPARPRLFLDSDAFALVLAYNTETALRLRAYGTDTAWKEQPIGDLSFKGNTYSGMPTQVTVPAGVQDYLREQSASSVQVRVDAEVTVFPSQIDGLSLWVQSGVGLYQDEDATTPADAEDDPVRVWQDQSGQGNDLALAGGYTEATLDPRGRVFFSGTVLEAIGLGLSGNQPFTLVMRLDQQGTPDDTKYLQIGSDASGDRNLVMYGLENGSRSAVRLLGGKTVWGDYVTRGHTLTLSYDGTGGPFDKWVDGSFVSVNNQSTGALAIEDDRFQVGGAPEDGGITADCQIAGLAFYDRALSDAERQQVEDYLTP